MSYLQNRCSPRKAWQQKRKMSMSSDNKGKIHGGHRRRINEKCNLMGFEFLEEHEQLERILFAVIPRGNTNEIAHRLIDRFGSIYCVLSAEADNLEEIDGVGKRTAEYLSDLLPLLGVVERSIMKDKSVVTLDTEDKIGEYAKTLFYDKSVENLYMVCLNSGNQVIRFDKISEGIHTSTDISVHKIVRTAVSAEASGVILAHNHPGGTLEPSFQDCVLTREIDAALNVIGVKLKAHIIVAGGRWNAISGI